MGLLLILKRARRAVAEREGSTQREVLDALEGLSEQARVDFLQMPPCEVSSSLVRRRLTAGEAIDELVGPEVAAYVAEQGLYGRQLRSSTQEAGQ